MQVTKENLNYHLITEDGDVLASFVHFSVCEGMLSVYKGLFDAGIKMIHDSQITEED